MHDPPPGLWFLAGLAGGLTAPSLALGLLLPVAAALSPGLGPGRLPLVLGSTAGLARAALASRPATPLRWDVPRGPPGSLERLRGWLRARLAPLPALSRETAAAFILGDPLPAPRRAVHARAGILHLASQSGMHVTLLIGLTLSAAAALRPGLDFRLPALALALFYTLLAGAKPGAVRAVVMVGAMLAARGLGYRAQGEGILALVAAGFLLVDPGLAGRLDFLLSFGATWGIVALAPALLPRLGIGPESPPATRAVGGLFVASLAATLATLPIQVEVFGAVPLAGVVLNLAAVPLGDLLVGLGTVLVAAAAVHPGLGLLVDGAHGPACHLLEAVAAAGAAVPSVSLGPPGALFWVVWMAALAELTGPPPTAPPGPRTREGAPPGAPPGDSGAGRGPQAASSASSPTYMRSQIIRRSRTENRM